MFGIIAVMIVGAAFIALGTIVISLSAFELGEETTKGTPFDSIGPGRYTIVKVKTDDSFVTDRDSRTFLMLRKGAKEDPEFYALPTNELEGTPQEGGIFEVSEIPSAKKMVFRK